MTRYSILTKLCHFYFRYSRALTLGVRCVLRDENEKILLVKHTYGPGWHLPGGGVEIGESCNDALSREIREECAILLVNDPKLISVFHDPLISSRDHVLIYDAAKNWKWQTDAGIASMEIFEKKFFPLNGLPKNSNQKMIESIYSLIT